MDATMCQCGVRPAADCKGAYEPGCDLGANEKQARVAPKGSEEALKASSVWYDDQGQERKERRRKDRAHEDERIGDLFNGFDNMIANSDDYNAGYLRAMRQAFGQLIASLGR